MSQPKTLLDLLRPGRPAELENPGQSIRFFQKPGEYDTWSVADLRGEALRWLGFLSAAGLSKGDEVVMPTDRAESFLGIFWGCLLGGFLPMPLAAPTNDATCAKILDILESRRDARLVLDDAGWERLSAGLPEDRRAALSARRVWPEGGRPGPDGTAAPVDASPTDIAFVQYSSGSTRAPKGVIIRHGQALANLRAIQQGSELAPTDLTFSWMPLSHDMGLVGFHLSPLFAGASQVLMPTGAFARTPLVWLQDAATLGATILSSPNFGYRHTLKALARKGLPGALQEGGPGLGAVRLIMNGAEPISVELATEFMESLESAGLVKTAMLPVYGLAEATLAVTFPALGKELSGLAISRDSVGLGDRIQPTTEGRALVACGCGSPLPGLEVRIAGADGGSLEAKHVGRVWIRGAGVTEGYHDDPEATAAAVMGEGWLDTGDLGFMDEGQLYITGRLKDLVIVQGQNYYPHDLEESLQAALGLDPLRVAVAPVRRSDAPEEIGVFLLHRGDPESFRDTAAEARKHLAETFGVGVDLIVPVAQIPRTTSGKVQRASLAAALLDGQFDGALSVLSPDRALSAPAPASQPAGAEGPADTSPQALERMMQDACAKVLGESRFGPTDNLFEQGMSSIDLAEIHGLIEARYPKGLDIRDFFDSPTIKGLSALLSERLAKGDATLAR